MPISLPRPALPASDAPSLPTTGNFTITEDFSGTLPPHWMTPRVPKSQWYRTSDGTLALLPRTDTLGSGRQPSFLARRQQHMNASAEVEIVFTPTAKSEAGLAAFQSDEFWFALGLTRSAEAGTILRLRQRSGPDKAEAGIILAEVPVPDGKPLRLRFEGEGARYQASWSLPGEDWQDIGPALDGKLLSTRTAGGFVGAVFGVYAETTE